MVRNPIPKKKVTFSLSKETVEELKEVVQTNHTWSQNRFVEEALREYIKKKRREILRHEFIRASRDPLFIADIKQVEEDFGQADAESTRLTA